MRHGILLITGMGMFSLYEVGYQVFLSENVAMNNCAPDSLESDKADLHGGQCSLSRCLARDSLPHRL